MSNIEATKASKSLHKDLWDVLNSLPREVERASEVIDSKIKEKPFSTTNLDADEQEIFKQCLGHKFACELHGDGWKALVFIIERPIKERLQGMPPFQFWIRKERTES